MTKKVTILIEKKQRRLALSCGGAKRVYEVELGKNWASDKAVEGDHATPLGNFYVCAKNPRSRYFLSLCISYPNAEDAYRGLADGLISPAEHLQIIEAIRLGKLPPQHTKLGGEIYIHGRGDARGTVGAGDWTHGCIALDNFAMQELFDLASIGTPVIIVE